MQLSFTIDGGDYSTHKGEFKKILTHYGLQWKGDLRRVIWVGKSESITGVFIRDEARNITISATLTWEGKKKTPFLKDFKEWIGGLSPRIQKGALEKHGNQEIRAMIEDELKMWDMTHKPDVEYLRSTGRPEDWIRKDVIEWKRERKKFEKVLQEKYSGN